MLRALKYFLVMFGLAFGGAALISTVVWLSAPENGTLTDYALWAWLGIAFILSMILAGVSSIFLAVDDADSVAYHRGQAIGNQVSIRSVTRGDSAWKWRTFLIFGLMIVSQLVIMAGYKSIKDATQPNAPKAIMRGS